MVIPTATHSLWRGEAPDGVGEHSVYEAGRLSGDEPPILHLEHPVSNIEDARIVRYHYEALRLAGGDRAAHQLHHLVSRVRIKVGCGLVGQNNVGAVGE